MREYMAVLVIVALVLAPSASVAAAANQLEVKPGTLSVRVVDHRSKALPEAGLKLMSDTGKVLSTVKADKQGKCSLKVKAGSYRLLVSGRIIVPFNVSDKAKVADLLVVVPEKPRYAAGQGGPLAWLANPMVIAGLVAVAIAIPLALHHSSSSGGKGHP